MIRPISIKRQAAKDSYNAQARIWKKDRLCACIGLRDKNGEAICSTKSHNCQDIHHQRGERGALLLDKRFWIPVCRKAHNWIHSNPEQARSLGLLPPVGQWNEVPK